MFNEKNTFTPCHFDELYFIILPLCIQSLCVLFFPTQTSKRSLDFWSQVALYTDFSDSYRYDRFDRYDPGLFADCWFICFIYLLLIWLWNQPVANEISLDHTFHVKKISKKILSLKTCCTYYNSDGIFTWELQKRDEEWDCYPDIYLTDQETIMWHFCGILIAFFCDYFFTFCKRCRFDRERWLI